MGLMLLIIGINYTIIGNNTCIPYTCICVCNILNNTKCAINRSLSKYKDKQFHLAGIDIIFAPDKFHLINKEPI